MSEGQWLAALPAELKSDATLTRYADVPALAKAHVALISKLGSRPALEVPADEAGWNKVYDTLGRPKDPSGYKLPATDAAKLFASAAHQRGLSAKQAEALFGDMDAANTKALGDRRTAMETELRKASTTREETFKKKWGDKYDEESGHVERAWKNEKYFPKELRDILERTGIAHHPAMVELANMLGHHLNEGTLERGAGGGTGLPGTYEAAMAALSKFVSDNKANLFSLDGFDPAAKSAKLEYTKLNQHAASLHPSVAAAVQRRE